MQKLDFKPYAYPTAFVFLWLAAIFFYKGLHIFGVAAALSCIAITVWRAIQDGFKF